MIIIRVKLCFKCQEYVPIKENDYLNTKEVMAFEKAHAGHPTQVVNEEEVASLKRWTGTASTNDSF